MSDLKTSITEATTAAMKARDKAKVAALRMVNAEIKRVEVDERRELSDEDVLTILNRIIKQRRDALSQYQDANRQDLAEQEQFEIALILEFLPEPLEASELEDIITAAIVEADAHSMKDMGKVMALVKAQVAGRADMSVVSSTVKAQLA
jgi:uncharacterized protein YqeY